MKSQPLTIDPQEVIDHYQKAEPSQRTMLEKIFGKELFQDEDWKELFRRFCTEHGLVFEMYINESLSDDEQAYQMLKAIVKHANNGWKPNWNDRNQWKYWPWFDLSVPSGFGFAGANFVNTHSSTNVGSRLCFKDRQTCMDTVNKYLPIYEKFITE